MLINLKNKYYDKFDKYINALIFFSMENKIVNQEEIKYLIFQLEEAKINAENNRYFYVRSNLFNCYHGYKDIDFEYYSIIDGLDSFLDEVHDEFENLISRYASREASLPVWEIKDFISQMFIYYNDFYQELINILINGIALNGDYIKVGPLNIAKMYFEYNLNFIDGYKMLMSELNKEVVQSSSVK